MKKSINIIFIIIAVVLVATAIIAKNNQQFSPSANEILAQGGKNIQEDISDQTLTTYVIPALFADAMLGDLPEVFVTLENPVPGISKDFCTKSEVDEKGNLVIYLNEKQKQDWTDFVMKFINDAKEVSDIEISSNYTKMTVKWSASSNNSVVALLALHSCPPMQLLEGQDSKVSGVEFTLIDKYTDEVIIEALYPYDRVYYGIKDGEFYAYKESVEIPEK